MIYGKKRLREIDRRVRYLSNLLERLHVIDPRSVRSERVAFGATVEVEDEDGRSSVYQIVGEDEVDAKNRRISAKSPVGQALWGKKVGDDALVLRPAGELELVITRIRYE